MAKFTNDVLLEGDNLRSYTAGAAIDAGAVVKATGPDTVQHADTTGEAAIGVALTDAASGDDVAVARSGTKVRAVDGAGDITAGDACTVNVSNANGELGTAATGNLVLGRAVTDGNSVGAVFELEIDLEGIVS